MCEAIVYLEENGERKKLMDNVSRIERNGDYLVLRKFLEPPLTVRAAIREIDMHKHIVILTPPETTTA